MGPISQMLSLGSAPKVAGMTIKVQVQPASDQPLICKAEVAPLASHSVIQALDPDQLAHFAQPLSDLQIHVTWDMSREKCTQADCFCSGCQLAGRRYL